MSNEEQDKMIAGHEYDGIQELDNPLPKWWLFIFHATIIFAIFYYFHYEWWGGPTQDEQLAANMKDIKMQQAAAVKAAPQIGDVSVEDLLQDQAQLAIGEKGFGQYCSSCHGQKGEGLIGPNLTDKYWMHSNGNFEGVLTALREGFPDKGMPPWKDVVPVDQHMPIAAYVLSLKGTNPANAKAPQGELVNE